MKKAKRVLSVLLAVFLLASCLPMTAWAEEGTPYTKGAPAGGNYTIFTADQLKALAETVNGGESYEGTTFTLTTDINLNGSENNQWEPIGNSYELAFEGIFDGATHKVMGLYINAENRREDDMCVGLFGLLSGTVRNLTIAGSVTVYGEYNSVGGIVGDNEGTVAYCYNTSNVTIIDDTGVVGGVVGSNGGTVANCFNSGEISGGMSSGGIVGAQAMGSMVKSCNNNGKVTGMKSGGIVGQQIWGTVDNCKNSGKVAGNESSAGIIGSNQKGTLSNCYNTGEVSGNGFIGGVAGSSYGGLTIHCYNTGTVSGEYDSFVVGGIIGQNKGVLESCYNTGTVTGEDNVGGVVGNLDWYSHEGENDIVTSSMVKNCYNIGMVSGTDNIGGVAGTLDEATLQDCYNLGTVVGNGNFSGGIVGFVEDNNGDAVKNCYYLTGKAIGGINGADASGKAERKTAAEFAVKSTFKNWNFTSVWGMSTDSNDMRPVLRAIPEHDFNDGNSSGGNPGGTNPPAPSGPSGPSDTEKPDNSGDETPSASKFIDVPVAQYYYNAVDWAVKQGIVAGTSDTTFSPNQNTTRKEIVTLLWRAAGRPESKIAINPFTDVKESDYYYKAVLWAYENKIAAGTSDTAFSPNQNCTRAQTVAFLYRYNGSPAASGSDQFTDVPSGEYYANAVAWATASNIVFGTSKDRFSPNSTCTRAQSVTFLYRNLAG